MKNDSLSTHSDAAATVMPRRQFLVLGSAAVAVAAASSLSAEVVRGVLSTEEKAPHVSAGFAEAAIDDFTKPSFATRVAGAAKLRSGDSSLTSGVRLKVHGIVRSSAAAARSEDFSVAIDAMYRAAGLKEAVPYMAWSHSQNRRRTTTSGAREFVVPVGGRQPLSLAVSSSAAAAVSEAKLRSTMTFSLGDERRTNKLRTGLYFLALLPAGAEAPDWASIRAVSSENGTMPALGQATITGLVPVSFDYIVVAASRA